MGILSGLSGRGQKIEHPFFGDMNFISGKKPNTSGYFECRRHFRPSNKSIEIGIEGEISGPTETQKDFFTSIEENYSAISSSIIPLIEDQVKNWKGAFKILNFSKEFDPVYLWLPPCKTSPIIWEIAFESEHDKNHTFTCTMFDLEAKEILIDG